MTPQQELIVQTFTNGPFMENCFIVGERHSGKAVLIDPGDEEDRLISQVRQMDLEVTEIFCTHTHIDHAGAVAALKRMLGVPLAVHPAEIPGLERMPMQASMFGLPPRSIPEVDRELAPGDTIEVGPLSGKILLTPGHSAGGCCLYFEQQQTVFVGDTLFAGSIGRTDLPGGDLQTLLTAIREELFCLPDEVMVYSGHGPETTIGVERRTNPFLQPNSPFI